MLGVVGVALGLGVGVAVGVLRDGLGAATWCVLRGCAAGLAPPVGAGVLGVAVGLDVASAVHV